MYLLTVQDPSTIILAGDSAGGGMILSVLVILRDRGLPLPAGAILISPWVDLTHSFPSVSEENPLDYIPSHGFHSRPSVAWPPPNEDDMLAIAEGQVKKLVHTKNESQATEEDAIQGFHVKNISQDGPTVGDAATDEAANSRSFPAANIVPKAGQGLSIMIDGKLVEIKDQIQMYATNQLISHPLVSPILQPSLGGLPPLLILTGGGELLRDEQIYLAHKAANPSKYPPSDASLDENAHDHERNELNHWKPTDVQLQVWDDLCHVAPTLSFTRPAKYMYRSVAQFGAWALARAQKAEIEILDDDDVSIISVSDSDVETETRVEAKDAAKGKMKMRSGQVGKAGDPLPAFKNHMIRQRVDRNGGIYPMEHASTLPGCNVAPNEIGVIKEGPVRKWMSAKRGCDSKFASAKRKVQKDRAKEMAEGYQTFGNGEVPPPSALAGRRRKGDHDRAEKNKRSWGLSLWSSWGSKHDKDTMEREQHADKEAGSVIVTREEGANSRPLDDTLTEQGKATTSQSNKAYSRSRSRRRTVTDEHQTDQPNDENTTVAELLALQKEKGGDTLNDRVLNVDAPTRVDSKISAEPASEKPAISKVEDSKEKPESSLPLEKLSLRKVEDEGAKPEITLPSENTTLRKAEDDGLKSEILIPSEEAVLKKTEDSGLSFDFDFLTEKSTIDKAEAEGLKTEASLPAAEPTSTKAEDEGLKVGSPPPTPIVTVVAPVEPAPSRQNTKSKRPKSYGIAFPFSLRRSGTKSATPSVASTTTITSSLGVAPAKEAPPKSPSISSPTDDEKDWKELEAGTHDKKSSKANSKTKSKKDGWKALEAGPRVKKSASTREGKRAPLSRNDSWKAMEAGAGVRRTQTARVAEGAPKKPLPMLKKRELPMLKKNPNPPTTLADLAATDEELLRPAPVFAKPIDSDQRSLSQRSISDYVTW